MTIEELNNEIVNIQKHLDNANRELTRLQNMNEEDLDSDAVNQMEEITKNITALIQQLESFIDQIEI